MDGETYTAPEAAKILGVSDRRIQQLAESGELEGHRDDGGRWHVLQHSVHARLEERGSGRRHRSPERPLDARANDSELRERYEALLRETGKLEGRLELTERTESTIREQLDRERARADRLEEEAARLRDQLEAERRRQAEREEEPVSEEPTPPEREPAPVQEAPPRRLWRRLFGG